MRPNRPAADRLRNTACWRTARSCPLSSTRTWA